MPAQRYSGGALTRVLSHLCSNPALLLVHGLTSLGFSFFRSVYEQKFEELGMVEQELN